MAGQVPQEVLDRRIPYDRRRAHAKQKNRRVAAEPSRPSSGADLRGLPRPRWPALPARTKTGPPTSRVSPRNMPIVIVAPERETPGTSATAWATPIATAFADRQRRVVSLARSDTLHPEEQQRAQREHDRGDERCSKPILDPARRAAARERQPAPCRWPPAEGVASARPACG